MYTSAIPEEGRKHVPSHRVSGKTWRKVVMALTNGELVNFAMMLRKNKNEPVPTSDFPELTPRRLGGANSALRRAQVPFKFMCVYKKRSWAEQSIRLVHIPSFFGKARPGS